MTLDEARKLLQNLDQMHRNLVRDGAVINTVVERSIFSDAAEALRTALAECDHLSGCLSMQKDLTAVVTRSRDLLRAENERLRDEMADYDRRMLARFDSRAAESTDLFTWIQCLRAENERLERKLAFYTLPDDYEAPH